MAIVMMKVMFMITLAIVLIVGFSSINIQNLTKSTSSSKEHDTNNESIIKLLRPRRASRFLAETDYENRRSNPKDADHCHKDNEVCSLMYGKNNTTCCNNKCMDLMEDKNNCGACKNKCKFTQQCCGGECVNLSYDKRHCGVCSNKCLTGQYCIYGMCDYA